MGGAVRVPLDRLTAIDMPAGGRVVVRGALTTSIDGSTFDAVAMLDLEAGGLRVAEAHPEAHTYVLAATGSASSACAAVGGKACLVPRLVSLAHERLRTGSELATTLSGGLEVEGPLAPGAREIAAGLAARVAVFLGGMMAVAMLAGAVRRWLRFRRRPLARVRAAARAALAATRGDPTLAPQHVAVGDLVERARQLEAQGRECLERLRRIDREGIARRIEEQTRAGATGASGTLAWLTRERDEAARLEGEVAATRVGLERIESALRVVALQARDAPRGGAGDPSEPLDALAQELDLRAASLAEAERIS
jgi:hypothetical protein